MSLRLLFSIFRNNWLIDKGFAEASLPYIFQFLGGSPVNLGHLKEQASSPALKAGTSAVYSVSCGSDISKMADNSIAYIPITGPLLKYPTMCAWGMTDYTALIHRIANARNVAAILLSIDSPGGEADGTATLADAIIMTKQQKPVVAVVENGMAASAAYWIASAAQELYVTQPSDQVGSVGVYTTIADWQTHYQEYFKLPVRDIYAPQSTEKNLPIRDAILNKDELIKIQLEVIADQFIRAVRRNRAGKLTSDQFTAGALFYARDAQGIGLIDGVKSLDQVYSRIQTLIKN